MDVFVEEARDWTAHLVSSSVRLETATVADERSDLMSAILRDLHTMKGAAGSVDLPLTRAIADRVHQLEDRLKAAGDPDAELVDHLISEVEWLSDAVERAAEGDRTLPTHAPAAPAMPAMVSPVEGLFVFVDDDDPRGAEASDSDPSRGPVPSPDHTPEAVAPAAAAPRPVATTRSSARKSEMLRIRPERIDAAHQIAGELVVSRLQTEALTADLAHLRDRSAHVVRTWQGLAGQLRQSRRALGAAWPIVDQKIASLQGQLHEIRQEMTGLARRATSVRDRSAGLIGTLDQRIRDLRMMPVHPFLEELLPVAREAGKVSGRRVRLEPDGGDAEVDRHVLSHLREPLLHVVRNAVVHGIEDEAERTRAGKPAIGTITVRARCVGPTLRVDVTDDGRGIDAPAVIAKARQKGLVVPDGTPDRDAVLRALTMQGFSTAAKVDGLAGRGVGMNVVAEAIRRLDGTISVAWALGSGSTFTIEVPIRSSTTAGLVVDVGELRVGLPLTQVQSVVRLTRSDVVSGDSHPFVRISGEPVAVTALGPFVGQPFGGLGGDKRPALVVKSLESRVTLLVDDIVGQREMLIKGLPPAFARHPLLVGGAVEADGSVLQVLDVAALIQRVQRDGVHSLPLVADPAPPRALVVDPSAAMQSLLGAMLRGEGFAVTGATSPREVTAAMSDPDFALVLVDPRMSGLEPGPLSQELASRPDPPRLVWMSFDEAERDNASRVGVRAFVDKKRFDQDAFLAMTRGELELR